MSRQSPTWTGPDAEAAFQTALSFELMARIVTAWEKRRRARQGAQLGVPVGLAVGVAAAFSLELHFKTVLLMHGFTPARKKGGHDLVALFAQIERELPAVARLIRAWYVPEIERDPEERAARQRGEPPTAFDAALKKCHRLFEKWRYAYEGPMDGAPEWKAWAIVFATRRYVRRERPAWRRHLPTWNDLPDMDTGPG